MRKKDTVSKDTTIVIRKAKAVKVIYWIFQALTLATLLASIVMYFVRHIGLETTLNQIFMCVMTLLTLNIPLLLERRFKVFIPNYITIVLYFLLFFHFVLGEVYRAYDHLLLFDKILHTTSGVIIAFASFSVVSILNNMFKSKFKLSPFFVVLFTFCFTMTSEYLWEIVEYTVDTLTNANMQRWQDSIIGEIPKATATGEFIISSARGSGLNDTMGDMIVNVLGALGVCIYAYIGMKIKPDWFTTKTILTKSDILELKDKPHVKIDSSYYKAVGIKESEYLPSEPENTEESVETEENENSGGTEEASDACVNPETNDEK